MQKSYDPISNNSYTERYLGSCLFLELLQCNIMFNIEASVDKVFCPDITLRVLDNDINYNHIRFERHFDNLGSEYENSIMKNVSTFN